MPRVGNISEIQEALIEYENEVNESELAETSKSTYLIHAQNFARWLDNDFEPGQRLRQPMKRRHLTSTGH